MDLNYQEAMELLRTRNQQHVLKFWSSLSDQQKNALLKQVAGIDFEEVERMQGLLGDLGSRRGAPGSMEPAEVVGVDAFDRNAVRAGGEELISEGKAGVILVAGGQGSRLGFEGPKGCYPIGPVSDRTLFHIHAGKIAAMEKKYATQIPFYIMTSEANDSQTRQFFNENDFLGLDPERVSFFTQNMWPALWGDGRLVMDRPDHIFMSPDGHGGLLAALRQRGMLDDMEKRGLTTLFYFQVDNPLVEIADPVFMGFHSERRADVSVKVCEKRDPEEGVGVVVLKDNKHAVAEYSELTEEQKYARTADGNLKFRFGSVAIHVFSADFLRQEASGKLPLHLAHKKVPYCDDDGQTVEPEEPNAYKFEKFIFDVLPDAGEVLNLEFRREDEFSPVKRASGKDSPDSARRDMIKKYARWLERNGVKVPRDENGIPEYRIEIEPDVIANPEKLKEKIEPGTTVETDLVL
jgi:UDP-N-acetylglucosamine/UDP-N-acetylgalactosamine diphosphorylase